MRLAKIGLFGPCERSMQNQIESLDAVKINRMYCNVPIADFNSLFVLFCVFRMCSDQMAFCCVISFVGIYTHFCDWKHKQFLMQIHICISNDELNASSNHWIAWVEGGDKNLYSDFVGSLLSYLSWFAFDSGFKGSISSHRHQLNIYYRKSTIIRKMGSKRRRRKRRRRRRKMASTTISPLPPRVKLSPTESSCAHVKMQIMMMLTKINGLSFCYFLSHSLIFSCGFVAHIRNSTNYDYWMAEQQLSDVV